MILTVTILEWVAIPFPNLFTYLSSICIYHLSIYLPIINHRSICHLPSIYLSAYHLPVYLFINCHLSLYLPIYDPFINLCTSLSVCLTSVCLSSVYRLPSYHLSLCLSTYLSSIFLPIICHLCYSRRKLLSVNCHLKGD